MTVTYGAKTHIGYRRRVNEDSYSARFPLFMVADGMGGHQAGDVASARVVTCMTDTIPPGEFLNPTTLTDALVHTSRELSNLGMTTGNPGSTMSGLVVSTHRGIPCARIFNIGDSRTYLLSGPEFSQITVDHSEYQELKDMGMLTEQEDRDCVHSNVLTKALGAGFGPSTPVDQFIVPITSGDRYVICSDGVSGELTDALIEMIARSMDDPQDTADELIRMALQAGGKDNATVIVVDMDDVFPVWENTTLRDPAYSSMMHVNDDTLPNERLTYLRGILALNDDNDTEDKDNG